MKTELKVFKSPNIGDSVEQANVYCANGLRAIHSFHTGPYGELVVLYISTAEVCSSPQPVTQSVVDETNVPVMQAVWKGPNGERKPAYVMSGVFGVRPGDKLAPDDPEAAPLPLLSDRFNLKEYEKWLMRVS